MLVSRISPEPHSSIRRAHEKTEPVRLFAVVPPRDLHRVSGVPQLHEPDALDDAAVLHVQARDDPLGQHPPGYSRSAFNASARSMEPSYRARPMIAPATPSPSIAFSRRRSSRVVTPPEAITGA